MSYCACVSVSLRVTAVEERMPITSKVGPCPAGAPDRPLRPHDLRRHCGGSSPQGERGVEGGAEGGGEGEGEEG